jgi:mycothione reductase
MRPTKTYLYAADVANTITHAAGHRIDATLDGVRWPDIRDRVFGLLDRISPGVKDMGATPEHDSILVHPLSPVPST